MDRGALARALRRRRGVFSSLDEQAVIAGYAARLDGVPKVVVDIGAGDGVRMSNTFALFRDGWSGAAFELDAARFARLARAHASFNTSLGRVKVTPENVNDLLRAHSIPRDFGVLSLDIDGYDYFVLSTLLAEFRPAVVCAEINEKFPPPLKFTVHWDPDHGWAGDHFFGQSISQLAELADRADYSLLELRYNNVYLAPRELDLGPGLTPEEAYEHGYRLQPDRASKFPWNADVDQALEMSPEEAEAFFREFFAQYTGRYDLSV
jgi:hypothetical protein